MNRRSRRGASLFAAALALILLPGHALAGNATNIDVTLPAGKAAVSGKITRHGGGAVKGAWVQLLRTSTHYPAQTALADASGNFTFYDLSNDQYILAVNPQSTAPTYMPGFYLKAGAPDHFTPSQSAATPLNYSGAKIAGVLLILAGIGALGVSELRTGHG